jgi:hypothetical protein
MSLFVSHAIAVLLLLVLPVRQPRPAASWMLDDFEDGDLKAASGVSWIVIADDLAGGVTEARLELPPGGTTASRHALRLAGRLGAGTSSFAGAWIPLERTGRSLDLSAFEGVRLRVKGPAPLDVGFRSGMVNFMARVEAGPDWRTVDVPFTTMVPMGSAAQGTRWNASTLQVFGVTTPQAPSSEPRPAREVTFAIDDVAFYSKSGVAAEPVATGPATGLAVVPFARPEAIPVTGWIDLFVDPERDGKMPALPDATRLEAMASGPVLWLRVTLRERPHDRWMGMNVALDMDGDPGNGMAWWGTNTAFRFDRLVTVWCFHVAAGCQGYIGLADAAQVGAGTFVAGGGDRLQFAIDRDRPAFVVGIPRDLLARNPSEIRLVAAVGSALLYADDVPGQGAASIR